MLFFIITTKKKNKWPEPSPPHPPTHTIFGKVKKLMFKTLSPFATSDEVMIICKFWSPICLSMVVLNLSLIHQFYLTLLGNIPTLRKLDPIIQFAFHELYNQYGKLFRLKMGPRWMLIVAGYNELINLFIY